MSPLGSRAGGSPARPGHGWDADINPKPAHAGRTTATFKYQRVHTTPMKTGSHRDLTDDRIRRIHARARRRMGALAGELARAGDGRRELIVDEMTFHRDLVDMVNACLET